MVNSENYDIFEINGLSLCVGRDNKFGTDALLLSKFVKPLPRHIVCDLCSGSGIIPFMLYSNAEKRPQKIYALDISSEAGNLLKHSLELNKIGDTDTIIPITEDLRQVKSIPRESVDIVTANPPYFKSGSGFERESAPQALARHELMCNIDDVAKAAAGLLKYGGRLIMCHIPDRLADVMSAMRKYNIEPKKLLFISPGGGSGKSKPWLFLINGKKGAKSGLVIEHTFTEEALKAE